MGIKERFSPDSSSQIDIDILLGSLKSQGDDLPGFLAKTAKNLGIKLDEKNIPIFRLDIANKYPPQGQLATGTIKETADSHRIQYVSFATYIACVEQLMAAIDMSELDLQQITAHNMAMVEGILHMVGLPDEEKIIPEQNLELKITNLRYENYCLLRAMLHLTVQAIPGLTEDQQKTLSEISI